jgi:hypothetical protein
MEERYTWIPFYAELAKALLAYKNNRKPLVDFVYSELSTVGGRSLVDYIHMEDGSKVKDIDPFSLFAIFNRQLTAYPFSKYCLRTPFAHWRNSMPFFVFTRNPTEIIASKL